jgi:hypothetical protein
MCTYTNKTEMDTLARIKHKCTHVQLRKEIHKCTNIHVQIGQHFTHVTGVYMLALFVHVIILFHSGVPEFDPGF